VRPMLRPWVRGGALSVEGGGGQDGGTGSSLSGESGSPGRGRTLRDGVQSERLVGSDRVGAPWSEPRAGDDLGQMNGIGANLGGGIGVGATLSGESGCQPAQRQGRPRGSERAAKPKNMCETVIDVISRVRLSEPMAGDQNHSDQVSEL